MNKYLYEIFVGNISRDLGAASTHTASSLLVVAVTQKCDVPSFLLALDE